MLKGLTAAFTCLVLAGSALADDGNPQPGLSGATGAETTVDRIAERAESLKEELSLTDEQTARVKTVLRRQDEQLKRAKTDTALPEDRKFESITAINKAAQDAILAILSPGQRAKWDEIHGGKPAGQPTGAGPPGGAGAPPGGAKIPPGGAGVPPGGARVLPGGTGKEAADPALTGRVSYLAQKLGLSADQRTQLLEIFRRQGEQMRALRTDTALTDDRRRERIAAINKETQAAISAILTPGQRMRWDALPGGGKTSP